MKIDGHYDPGADIAWLRLGSYDPNTIVAEETSCGLLEVNSKTGRIVAIECWNASSTLPQELLTLLPPPGSATAA